jgi:hypothetical protein
MPPFPIYLKGSDMARHAKEPLDPLSQILRDFLPKPLYRQRPTLYDAPLPLSGWPLTPPLGILQPFEEAAKPELKFTPPNLPWPSLGDDTAHDDLITAPLAAVNEFVRTAADDYLIKIFGDLETAQRLAPHFGLEENVDVKVIGSVLHATVALKLHAKNAEDDDAGQTTEWHSEF